MRFILSRWVFRTEFQVSRENRYFRFVFSQITNLIPQRGFVAETASFLHQCELSMKHRHFSSELTQTSTISPVRAFILDKTAFLGQFQERIEKFNISPIVLKSAHIV